MSGTVLEKVIVLTDVCYVFRSGSLFCWVFGLYMYGFCLHGYVVWYISSATLYGKGFRFLLCSGYWYLFPFGFECPRF